MAAAPSARIHPSAVISPETELAEGVEIGPYVVIDGPVQVGPDCKIRPGAYLRGPLSMGSSNIVHSGVVLGDDPQHTQYGGEATRLEIGDYNTFREHVTIHRGTSATGLTRIGSHNFFMANSHVAHDCRIGNRCILANCALLAGHCVLEDNVFISGNSAVHQFVRIGRLAFLSGCSATTKDIPPFIIQQGINQVKGINVIGMRRAGMTPIQLSGVRRAFRILFREELALRAALARIERELGTLDVVAELLAFLRSSQRGINKMTGTDALDLAA